MTYYFINYDSVKFGRIRDRLSFLSDADSVDDLESLEKVLAHKSDLVFFLSLNEEAEDPTEAFVRTIREKASSAKILYILPKMEAHDLKAHQKSELGGDAYLESKIEEQILIGMLESLFPEKNDLESKLSEDTSERESFKRMKEHPISQSMDELFARELNTKAKKSKLQSIEDFVEIKEESENGESMSDKDQELSLDDLGELELGDTSVASESTEAAGLELSLDEGMELDLSETPEEEDVTAGAEFSLSEEDSEIPSLSLDEDEEMSLDSAEEDVLSLDDNEGNAFENLGELDLSDDPLPETPDDEIPELSLSEEVDFGGLSLDSEDTPDLDLSLSEEESSSLGDKSSSGIHLQENVDDLGALDELDELDELEDLSFGSDESDLHLDLGGELSDDALEKLKEIDAIMTLDASQVNINVGLELPSSMNNEEEESAESIQLSEEDLDEPLVSDDLNLDNFDFSSEEDEEVTAAPVAIEEKPRKKRKEAKEVTESRDEQERDYSQDFKEISGAYSGEMERTQATISNLRIDREELLKRIQQLEEDKLLQNRQTLSMRAELDEKKIELSIIRKKLNEEINELKDRLKFQDERRLILEEKNRILTQELDKAGQRNKIDVKKVQMREKELEQKLELLKSDAESQIRNRDLKILELKRKIDAMEFDMDSISQQEKKSVESRFELEDKLDKAIKTLRTAISVLEDDSDRGSALEALKKNIDM
jgi:hypothetical protein